MQCVRPMQCASAAPHLTITSPHPPPYLASPSLAAVLIAATSSACALTLQYLLCCTAQNMLAIRPCRILER